MQDKPGMGLKAAVESETYDFKQKRKTEFEGKYLAVDESVNKTRRERRRCLGCDKEFDSISTCNRVCEKCKKHDTRLWASKNHGWF